MNRLSSDGSLPNRNWVQITASVDAINTPKRFTASSLKVIRVLILAPSANPADVVIGPNSSANFKTLVAGDEYLIEAEPGHSFDLSEWYLTSSNASSTLRVIYQPA